MAVFWGNISALRQFLFSVYLSSRYSDLTHPHVGLGPQLFLPVEGFGVEPGGGVAGGGGGVGSGVGTESAKIAAASKVGLKSVSTVSSQMIPSCSKSVRSATV